MEDGEKNTIHIFSRDEWSTWLEENGASSREIWLIYYKKHTGKPRISYDDAVEEAICFGWIDSIVQRIDDERYAQKFTPRREKSSWSPLNIWRAQKMYREGRMRGSGMEKAGPWIKNTPSSNRPERERAEPDIPGYLKDALMMDPHVWNNFLRLSPSERRNYIGWITSAKKMPTREKRLKEAIGLLRENQKLGLK